MKHFTKIKPGAVKSQRPSYCQECGKKVDKDEDNFSLEAHWKTKRKADTYALCSLKCLYKWSKP